jgi:hypothetical protein
MPGQPDTDLKTKDVLLVLDKNTDPSNLVVDKDLEFSVVMEFTIAGISKTLLGFLTFEVVYTYESIGAGSEGELGKVTGKTVAGQDNYGAAGAAGTTTELKVPPGKITPGVFRLAAVVTFKLALGTTTIPWPITGFTESPAIQVTT